MSLLRTPPMRPHSPVRGTHAQAPLLKTEAPTKATEQAAAARIGSVSEADLDVFLQARAQKTGSQNRGVLQSLGKLLGIQRSEAAAVQELKANVAGSLDALSQIYADGWVTEHEVGALLHARNRMADVLRLAEPDVLLMLPRDVRARLESNLFGPLLVLQEGAQSRGLQLFEAIAARDSEALAQRLAQPVELRALDLDVLARTGTRASALERYVAGDVIAVPRSNGGFTRGVVVANRGDRLDIEMLVENGTFARKTLLAADVAKANPLKVGDAFRTPGGDVRVLGVDAHGLWGEIREGGQVRAVRADELSRALDAAMPRAHDQTAVVPALARVPGFSLCSPAQQRALAGLLALRGDPVFGRAADELSRRMRDPALLSRPVAEQATILAGVLGRASLLPEVMPNFGAARTNAAATSRGAPVVHDGGRCFATATPPPPAAVVTRLWMRVGGSDKQFNVVLPESWPAEQRSRKLDELVGALQLLPPESLGSLESVVLNPERNPSDAWFEREFNMPGFTSAMTAHGDDRRITVYPAASVAASLQTFAHEVGHLVSIDAFGDIQGTSPAWGMWRDAAAHDATGVSQYGAQKPNEDFAEVYSLYATTKGTARHDQYRALMPHRFALLDEIFVRSAA